MTVVNTGQSPTFAWDDTPRIKACLKPVIGDNADVHATEREEMEGGVRFEGKGGEGMHISVSNCTSVSEVHRNLTPILTSAGNIGACQS